MSLLSHDSRASADAPAGDAAISRGGGVAWRPVLLLSALLTLADVFWLTVLRQSVGGAIPRVQAPFSSWWHESLVLLPVFVLAVLAAVTLTHRARVAGGVRAVAMSALLLMAAGTIAGVLVTAGSSGHDYYLGVTMPASMRVMKMACDAACVDQRHHDLLVLHIHGLLYISRWIVLSNAVLVTGFIAATRGRQVGDPGHRRPGASRAGDLRAILVVTLAGAAAIHASVVPAHLTEWGAGGAFFILLAIWQLALAGLLLVRVEERLVLIATAAVSVLPLLVWLVSRTVGLPFGPEAGTAEAVALPDLVAGLLEIGSLAMAVALLRAGRLLAVKPAVSAHARSLALVAVVAVTAISLGGVGLSWLDVYSNPGAGSVMDTAHQGS